MAPQVRSSFVHMRQNYGMMQTWQVSWQMLHTAASVTSAVIASYTGCDNAEEFWHGLATRVLHCLKMPTALQALPSQHDMMMAYKAASCTREPVPCLSFSISISCMPV